MTALWSTSGPTSAGESLPECCKTHCADVADATAAGNSPHMVTNAGSLTDCQSHRPVARCRSWAPRAAVRGRWSWKTQRASPVSIAQWSRDHHVLAVAAVHAVPHWPGNARQLRRWSPSGVSRTWAPPIQSSCVVHTCSPTMWDCHRGNGAHLG